MNDAHFGAGAVRRPFAIYIAWRPEYRDGRAIAERLYGHFTDIRYRNVVGGTGVSVLFCDVPAPPADSLFRIDWQRSAATVTVLLVDSGFSDDPAAVADLNRLAAEPLRFGPATRVIPVIMEPGALPQGLNLQALRWDRWEGDRGNCSEQLVRELSHEFCQMLLSCVRRLERPSDGAEVDDSRSGRVRVFLSHSKHDSDGERIAVGLRDWIDQNTPLGTFFDVRDISPGVDFEETLRGEISVAAFVSMHSDSYASRPMCRTEVLEAKKRNRPFLVVNCVREGEDRAFPYLGNVRSMRLDPDAVNPSAFASVTSALLDEVFQNLLWRCQVAALRGRDRAPVFLPRRPELLNLISLPSPLPKDRPVVYPDPGLTSEEAALFRRLTPGLRMLTLTQWQEDSSP